MVVDVGVDVSLCLYDWGGTEVYWCVVLVVVAVLSVGGGGREVVVFCGGCFVD